jgi:hypothetical protein
LPAGIGKQFGTFQMICSRPIPGSIIEQLHTAAVQAIG